MIETKVIQVRNSPETINMTNKVWGDFGWKVINVQVTFSQNTKTYTGFADYVLGTGIDTVETTTVDYATITYQRDTEMPGYQEFYALEEQFNETIEKMEILEIEKIPGQASCEIALSVIAGLCQFIEGRILFGVLIAILGPFVVCKIYEMTAGKRIDEVKKKGQRNTKR